MTGTTRPTIRARRTVVKLAGSCVVALVLGTAACGDAGPETAPTVTVWVDRTQPAPTSTQDTTGGAPPPTSAKPAPTTSTTAPARVLRGGGGRDVVTTWAEAKEVIADADSNRTVTSFRSPTGNLYCRITATAATCETDEGRIKPPSPGICPADGPRTIGRIVLTAEGAVPQCNADSIRDPRAKKLKYGSRTTHPDSDIVCVSEDNGITCASAGSRHGFFLARGAFATF